MFFKITLQKIAKWETERRLEKLIKVLDQPDPVLRKAAVASLGRLGNLRAAEPLIQLKNDPAIQQDVAKALESIARTAFAVIGSLTQQSLSKQDKDFLKALPVLLRQIGRPAVRAAQSVLLERSPQIRLTAVQLLGDFNATQATRPLVDRLSDPEPLIRQITFDILTKFGIGETRPVIARMIHEEQKVFCAVAADMIRRLSQAPSDGPALVDYAMSVRDFSTIAALGEKAVEPVMKWLAYDDAEIAQTTEDLLLKIGEASIPALIRQMDAKESEKQCAALKLMMQIKPETAVTWHFKKLWTAPAEVKAVAAQGIANHTEVSFRHFEKLLEKKDPSVSVMLIRHMQGLGWNPQTPAQRIYTAMICYDREALIREGNASVRPVLEALQADTSGESQPAMIYLETLGELGDKSAIPVILAKMESFPLLAREKALKVLDQLVDEKTLSQLDPFLADPDSSIRRLAAGVFAHHGQGQWQKVITGSADDFLSLAQMGSTAAIKRLIALVQERKSRLTEFAAQTLMTLAKESPQVLLDQWKTIHGLLTESHADSHTDVDYNRSSDCTHDDIHSDVGYGLDFPAKPPRKHSGPRDF